MCILIMYFLSVLQPSSLSRDIETKALIKQRQIYPKHICVIRENSLIPLICQWLTFVTYKMYSNLTCNVVRTKVALTRLTDG